MPIGASFKSIAGTVRTTSISCDEGILPDQKKTMTKTKTMTVTKTNTFREHLQRAILMI